MGKAIVRITPTGNVTLPPGTIVDAVRQHFETQMLELRVEHPSIPETLEGVPLPYRVICCDSMGESWFE